jgi:hypothetical protein
MRTDLLQRIKIFEPSAHGQQPNHIFNPPTTTVEVDVCACLREPLERAYPSVDMRSFWKIWLSHAVLPHRFSFVFLAGPWAARHGTLRLGVRSWSRTDQLADVLSASCQLRAHQCDSCHAKVPNCRWPVRLTAD